MAHYQPMLAGCPGQKPAKCTTTPQPCPGHPGVTFCNSDPRAGQCGEKMPHKVR
eukprot:SAG11_NODE_1744_length_4334_cov_32.676033_1_plen_54_part_00